MIFIIFFSSFSDSNTKFIVSLFHLLFRKDLNFSIFFLPFFPLCKMLYISYFINFVEYLEAVLVRDNKKYIFTCPLSEKELWRYSRREISNKEQGKVITGTGEERRVCMRCGFHFRWLTWRSRRNRKWVPSCWCWRRACSWTGSAPSPGACAPSRAFSSLRTGSL